MVVKPMSLLTKNGGDGGVPTSLVVNGTRYTSVKKPRSLKSDVSPERDELVGKLSHDVHSPDQVIRSKDAAVFEKFEKFDQRDDVMTGHEIHHPSLHSPEMLSTKGHAISRDSRDELSSLRSRLASLRGSPHELLGMNAHNLHQNAGALEEHTHAQKNWATSRNSGNNSNGDNMFNIDSSDETHRNFHTSPGKIGNDHWSRSRMQSLHGSEPAHMSNGGAHQPSREDGGAATQAHILGLDKLRNHHGTIMELEKPAANGGIRVHEKKERSSRSRHRQQQQQLGTMEYLTNGDVQMVYERDDRSSSWQQGLPAPTASPDESKMTNPVRQAVHDIAEKARRSRNRIHHQSTEILTNLQLNPQSVKSDYKVDTDKALASSNNNLRVPDAAKGSSLPGTDDVNRIHQRSQPPSSDARDHSPRSSDAVVTGDSPNGNRSFNFHQDVRDGRLRHRRHPTPKTASLTHAGLHQNQLDLMREDSLVRGLSHYKSTIYRDSSDEQSLHSHQRDRSHQSSLHDQRDDHSPGSSQPRSSRSSSHAQVDSPSKLSLRSYDRDDQLHSHRSSSSSHLQPNNLPTADHSTRGREASSISKRGPKSGQTWFAATELQSNLLVEVVDSQFHLHKFPLLSRSGHLNRLVFESRDTNKDHIKLHEMPGGPEAFELAIKFCYGIPVELTPLNVATLRCAAEYLEMTDSLEDGNLVSKTEHYLSFVVLASWKDSITVLQSCQRLLPWAEELQIVRRCSESVAWKACTDPHGIRWSFSSNSGAAAAAPVVWDGGKQVTQVAKHIPHDWWVEDILQLNLDAFSRVMTAIKAKGMAYTLVGSAIAQYATRWLPGLEKKSRRHHDANSHHKDTPAHGIAHLTGKEIVVREITRPGAQANQEENRAALIECIVGMLPPQQDALSCSFLLRLLRAACLVGAGPACKAELERRVGMQMEQASLSDLLIPSSQSASETLYDIDVVHRILEQFLLKSHSGAVSPTRSITTEKQLHVFDSGPGKPPTAPHTTKTKVAKLMDAYLAEVARDINLPLAKFQSLAESLPEFSRASDDGLYRAIDTYLKTHPTMIEHERKKLCRVMDCQRLSLEACLHAAQNERLPLRVVVQVLFSEQVKLRNAITGNTLVKKNRDPHNADNSSSSAYPSAREQSSQSEINHQIVVPRVDNSNAGGLSLQESWQSARRDIKSLKQEIERMKSKFSELEHDYSGMTQQVEKLSKSKHHSTSGWTSGWRRLSSHMKPPNIFNYAKHEYPEHSHKDDAESVAPTHVSTPTHDLQSTPTAAAAAAADQRRRSHSVTSTSSAQRWRNSIS